MAEIVHSPIAVVKKLLVPCVRITSPEPIPHPTIRTSHFPDL